MPVILFFPFSLLALFLSYIDFKTRRLPDYLTFALLWAGLLLNPYLGWGTLYEALLGVCIAYLTLTAVALGYRQLKKREGLGLGDAKFIAALAAWFGYQAIPLLLAIATLSTLIILALLKVVGRYPANPYIPLGPGLALAGTVLFLVKILTIG